MSILAFVALAVVATIARAVLTAGPREAALPWRTLAVNTLGAGLLGFIVTTSWWSQPVAITAGALGSFTTFSTVAGETAGLLDSKHKGIAVAYVMLTLVAGIAAAWLGIELGTTF